jgi:erythronate-4-phosphate dehydrogenase
VIDEKILIQWMKEKHSGSGFHSTDGKASPVTHHLSLILDVWPHEPDINLELLGLAEIATPHIAGYSVEGKYNATKMIAKEVSQFFSIGIDIPPLRSGEATDEYPAGRAAPYDILADDRRLRESPGTFEQQRNKYPERWEFLH